MTDGIISFRQALFMPTTIKRGLKVALIVGTLLIFINHTQQILNRQWPALWEILLTYLVPYSVSSHATAANISEFSKNKVL
ncbi:nitrate/nitrite transporter NrtS [Hellea sp.]|nr:nitrate/nitrite transporter NrtS [Hellea sp.]